MEEFGRGNNSIPSRSSRERLSRSSRIKKGKKKGWRRYFNLKWISIALLTGILGVFGWALSIIFSAESQPIDNMDKIEFSSNIYDGSGKQIAKLGPNRELVSLDDIKSKDLVMKTFIAVEDRRFLDHGGVDWKGMMRAVAANLRKGGKAEGGGTITMQVARNIVLDERQKTFTRKLKEVGVAWELERNYSKEEILEAYLNFIDLGNQVMGLKMAAKIYFDKDITKDELEPQEIALLAGLPKAPTTYNPYLNPERAKERRNVVLMVMAEQGVISQADKEKYQKMDLGVNKEYLTKYLKDDDYQPYKQYVISEAKKRYDIDETDLTTGGYDIYTHLVPEAQQEINTVIKDDEIYQNHEQLDGGATILDVKTGGIVAVAGGRRYQGRGFPLRATAKVQPGSTIKPITVYAPAVEKHGYDEYTLVDDSPDFKIGEWKPQNVQRTHYGKVPLQEVLNKSLNVATASLLYNTVKLPTAAEYAERLGLELDPKDKESYSALALGGLTYGETTVNMAQAYSAFANHGKMTPAHAIKEIKYNGKTKEPTVPLEKDKQVLEPKTAWYMTRMMKDNMVNGTGVEARLEGRDSAGKTGTTQKSKEAWFVGYTCDYVMAATVFNTDSKNLIELTGGGYPGRMFNKVMTAIHEGKPPCQFQRPPGVEDPKPPVEIKPVNDLRAQYQEEGHVVRLTWTEVGEAGQVEYTLERSENQRDWQTIGKVSGGEYLDRGLPPPTEEPKRYFYRLVVKEVDSGEENHSNVASVDVMIGTELPDDEEDPTQLDPVSDLTARQLGLRRVNLSWSRHEQRGVTYIVQRSTGNGDWVPVTSGIPQNNYTDTLPPNPPASGRYVYRVIAVYEGVQSEPSNEVTIQLRLSIPSNPGDE